MAAPTSSRSDRSGRSSRSASRSGRATSSGGQRQADKAKTRRALLDGAMDLLEHRSLDRLGIREVTRAAGVTPAAFYRHFESIDELALVLVDEAFATLRQLMRDARDDVTNADDIIRRSVTVLVRHIHDNRAHYRFVAREQFGAIAVVRTAINREIKLFSTELATDLARLPGGTTWPLRDLVMLADMIVGLMVDTARRLLDAIDTNPELEAEIVAEAERRLRYLAVAATVWQP